MIRLSRLEEIKDLRTVWPHEALDFTPWLSQDDNISLLGNALGIDISVDETESTVGILMLIFLLLKLVRIEKLSLKINSKIPIMTIWVNYLHILRVNTQK